jgi:hypothetical protein
LRAPGIIQFARFLSPLRRIASQVIVWCQPQLLPLFAAVEGVDRVLPLHEGMPEIGFDVDIEIMEIPHAIRATSEQVQMRRPYLQSGALDCATEGSKNDFDSIGLTWDVGNWDR